MKSMDLVMTKLKCKLLGHIWDNCGRWTRQCKRCKETQEMYVDADTGDIHWDPANKPTVHDGLVSVAIWSIVILIIYLVSIEIYFWIK